MTPEEREEMRTRALVNVIYADDRGSMARDIRRLLAEPVPDIIVFAVGTKVVIGQPESSIEGMIVAVQIGPKDHVIYQVVWWNGRTREEKWFDLFELLAPVRPTEKIGFTTGESS